MRRLSIGWRALCFLAGMACACTQEMPPVLAPEESAQDAAGSLTHDAAGKDDESPGAGDAGLADAAVTPVTDALSGDGGPKDSAGRDGGPPDAGFPAVLPDAAH